MSSQGTIFESPDGGQTVTSRPFHTPPGVPELGPVNIDPVPIYESPDGGKTVYVRMAGSTERRLVKG